jgi:phosphoenolpyruvate carboxykinase (ATP)
MVNRERAIDYLNTRESHLYVVDGFAGWDPSAIDQGAHHLQPRVPRALHVEHADPPDARRSSRTFGDPDYVIFNAGAFPRTATRAA